MSDGPIDSNHKTIEPRLDEDHGTSIRSEIYIQCQIQGCTRQPQTQVKGYIHFTMDGESYSRDSLWLCEGHRKKLERIMEAT